MDNLPICTIPNCGKRPHARGLCNTHYSRWRSNGDAHVVRMGGAAPQPIEQRFWKHVPNRDAGACWEWNGFRDKDGYGKIRWDNKTTVTGAHRISWQMKHGPLPRGLCVCHTCDNPPCVNPDHLVLGTYADNSRDRDSRGRANAPRGAQNGHAVLSEKDVREIRRMLVSGAKQRSVADKYGIHQTTVQNIGAGKRWRWLE